MASLLELSRTVAAQSYTFWLCDNYDLVDNKPSISERKKEGCVCTEPDLIIAKTMLANFFLKNFHKKKAINRTLEVNTCVHFTNPRTTMRTFIWWRVESITDVCSLLQMVREILCCDASDDITTR